MMHRNERIELIRRALENLDNKIKQTDKIPWREDWIFRPIIRLPISCLMFNIDNFRTKRQQIEFLQNSNLERSIFDDPESSRAQESQFEILKQMLNESDEGLKSDLESHGQDDPAIITYDGFIVNGNRRIAALRILGKNFANCVVLPEDASKDDLYLIEQTLQVSKDFKQPYHWINELISIDFGLNDRKISADSMSKLLRIDVKNVLAKKVQKSLVDEFLEWKGIPKSYNYKMLNDAEQAFGELEKFWRTSKLNQSQKEEAKLALFNLIDVRPPEGRLYGYIGPLFKHFSELHEKLLREEPVDEATKIERITNTSTQEKPIDPLIKEVLSLETQEVVNSKTKKVESLADPTKSFSNTIKIIDALGDVRAEKDEQNKNDSLITGIDKALKILSGLSFTPSSTNLKEAEYKLLSIIKKSSSLLEAIRSNNDPN